MKKKTDLRKNMFTFAAILLFVGIGIQLNAQIEAEKNWLLTGNTLSGTEFIGSKNNKPFVFKTNNIERLRIDAMGNVGIGVINASEKLEIAGGLKLGAINPENSANGTIVYNGNDFLIRKNNEWMSLVYKSPWDTNSVSVFTNRNVGLGVDAPKESLELDGAIRFHSYNKGKNRDEMDDGTVFYDGNNILAKVDGKIDTLTDNGTTPQPEELLWRKNAPRTNYTFFNVGIGTNTADKPLHILGKIGSTPTIRFTHKYIVPSINPEFPLDSAETKDSPKAPGDTIIKDADIWSANGGLFFTIEGHPADFGFTHTTMQSRVRFLCDNSIMTRNNLFVENKVFIGNETGSWDNPPAQLYVNGNSLMEGNVTIGSAESPANLTIKHISSLDGTMNMNCNLNIGSSSKIIGNNDINNYYIGGYSDAGVAKLDIHWYGGVRVSDGTGPVMEVSDGTVKIGDGIKMYKDGRIWAYTAVNVNLVRPSTWPDFLFEKDYKLKPLEEVEEYINANKHLEGIPSASEIEKTGINLGEMTTILTQKMEEMTLYMIEMNKTLKLLKEENEELKNKIKEEK